jgi:hypothetical protein
MPSRSEAVLDRLEEFLSTGLDEALTRSEREDPAARAIALFHEAARSVPAYAKFLAARGVEPNSVRSEDDFSRLHPNSKA